MTPQPSVTPSPSMMEDLRKEYHKQICAGILGHRPGSTFYSNADSSSSASVDFAQRMAASIVANTGRACTLTPPSGQAAGALFGTYTKAYLEAAFGQLQHIRPGRWVFSTSQIRAGIAGFDQYQHLAELKRVLDQHVQLKAALGGDYFITPDIVVSRSPLTDQEIDQHQPLINNTPGIATHTPLRAANHPGPTPAPPILHASISCKWTMRSDRAQNTRTEALNLIRNRKGQVPHIIAVTFEPLPSRLASIAMGTGDVDCTYHGALHELRAGIVASGAQDQLELLDTLIDGRRLRDISDLPFDLAT